MFIHHRVNTIEQLLSLPAEAAIEFDVRDSNGTCIITHDPFTNGVPLEEFLDYCSSRFLIINIKSERIEHYILEQLKKRNIDSFFFLDCGIPMIHTLTQLGESRIAVRYSEYEPIEFVNKWIGKVQWVWVDCFSKFILTKDIESSLHSNGFKVCIVSPELQGRPDDIDIYKQYIQSNSIEIDAICTKSYMISKWT